jgi:acyl-CoA synthetase (NDP forming)
MYYVPERLLIIFEHTELHARQRKMQETPAKNISRYIEELLKLETKTLTEHMSKKLLSFYEIPVTKEGIATTAEEAVEVGSAIGYPVAVKVNSPAISHKTEANAVVLGVKDNEELIQAYRQVLANAREYNPRAQINGILIQEMVNSGVEIILGMTQDPQFGPTIMLGLGGIFAEVLKDVSCRIAPLTRFDIEDMIREIKGFQILQGFRRKPKSDIESIIDVATKLSRLSIELEGVIKEIDINPLVVFEEGKGAKAVDALIVLK